MLGLYVWEWFTSLDFDWQYISGKKKFRWPLTFYFLGRYCLLFSLIGITIALNVTSEIDCQALYTFNSVFGNSTIGLASINLSLRTMAVWSQRWYIIAPLVVIILGHWSLLLHGVVLKAEWQDGAGCVITGTNTEVLSASWIYTMAFDFIVLSLTAYKLLFPTTGRSRLVNLIFSDGLIYFAIAFLANMIATIFMLLNLNPVMSIIANVPAAVASTIVACRAVRRLSQYTSKGPEVFATTTQGSTLAFRSGANNRPKLATKVSTNGPTEGVHVQMETFEHTSPKGLYDAAGNLEAQTHGDEYKHPPY
ncbi:hypothetical protein AX16_004421 [Volvariella volvacea WC 439]|nr:hypothetical protein AX16_004421 [Volvariella volvacea WC 439]